MKTQVRKSWLIDKLMENRRKHREAFLKAMDAFRKVALERFEKNVALLKEGKDPEVYISFDVPKDQTRDYDRVIGLLYESADDLVVLDEKDYMQYVLDQWAWKRQWLATNSSYTGEPIEDEE